MSHGGSDFALAEVVLVTDEIKDLLGFRFQLFHVYYPT